MQGKFDGKSFTAMHRAMSNGLMHATTGAVVAASQLGLVIKPEELEELRKPVGDSRRVRLGVHAKPHILFVTGPRVEQAKKYVKGVADIFDAANSKWPSADSQAWTKFLDDVLAATVQARSLQVNGIGLRGGKGTNRYLVKHFTRMILLLLEYSIDRDMRDRSMETLRRGDPIAMTAVSPIAHPFENEPLSHILQWTPDELSHCKPLLAKKTSELAKLYCVPSRSTSVLR